MKNKNVKLVKVFIINLYSIKNVECYGNKKNKQINVYFFKYFF